MFDKLKFNNLVITNKKLIQKGRAQTIAKLVNKLRKLKDAQVKQPEEKKHQERLRKNVECMTELKSLKHMEIMRALLLQHDGKNHTAVLTNGRATPDERAIAMLGLCKIMQSLVAAFRQGLNLCDAASADWRDEMLQTSKRRLKHERTEEKRRKRKELKEQKAQTRNRLEWLEEHQPDADKGSELVANVIETVAGTCTVETAETAATTNNANTDKSVKKLKRKDNSMKEPTTKPKNKVVKQQRHKEKAAKAEAELKTNNVPKKCMEEAQPEMVGIKEKSQKQKQTQKLKEQGQQIQARLNQQVQKPKRVQEEVNLKVHHTNAEEQTQSKFNHKVEKSKKEEKQRPTHVVDPFFITESGQPYLSSAVVLSGDSHNESDEDEHYVEQRKRKPLAKKPDYNNSYNNSSNYNPRSNNDRHPSWDSNKNNSNNNSLSNDRHPSWDYNKSNTNNNPSSNDRHPSWLAKEQQKPTITNFKGKKTKFSDDGNIAETIAAAPTAVADAPTDVEDSAAGMHPSWLAKQKMKPKIAAFAGTKIKFDD